MGSRSDNGNIQEKMTIEKVFGEHEKATITRFIGCTAGMVRETDCYRTVCFEQ